MTFMLEAIKLLVIARVTSVFLLSFMPVLMCCYEQEQHRFVEEKKK